MSNSQKFVDFPRSTCVPVAYFLRQMDFGPSWAPLLHRPPPFGRVLRAGQAAWSGFIFHLRDAYSDGLIDSRPHFNSVRRYLSDSQLTDILKELITVSSLPLKAIETDSAVDSSGFSTSRFVRWFNRKYGREIDNRQWVKVHLMCGVQTKIVTAFEISGWAANDTTYFVPLVAATAQNFLVKEVSADKAYLSRKNLQAVELVGGMPSIPFKPNTLEPTEAGAWAKMCHLFMHKREEYMEHYHKRSNIETAHSMIKGKFGSALRSKSDTGQINEALCKVLCHNICVLERLS